ncbi:hypothetical protein [Amycolatopsis sp. GM8]|uniref:hypothetical protein n=1 Tax=Amycolatopsis sp. GM8 TaxID=2896530 RepID=UPI001F4024CE|nr:hypothetical protein [Amycolatopsis sp. GM8]
MSAKDDADFGDGTQSALPPVAFGDALTGSLNEPDDHEDFKMTRVASPVRPDPDAVRELVDASMADAQQPGSPQAGTASPGSAIPPAPPLGMLPRQRTRPSLPSFRRPQLRMPRLPQPGARRPSTGSTAIIVAVLLILVYAFVAIEFLSSLISSISGLFN